MWWWSAEGQRGSGPRSRPPRAGADTLLLERYGFFEVLRPMAVVCRSTRCARQACHGVIHELIIEGLRSYGDDAVRISDHALVCNVEYLKVAVMDVLDQVGCRYWLHSRIVDARVEQGAGLTC